MPKPLAARPTFDETEAHQVRKLAHSAHAPADWIFHVKLVVRSWDGLRTRPIAEELGCNPRPCANACMRSTSVGSMGSA
jgi:hypothetical protein